ncbi:MAG: hypothetical protein QM753_05545 [Thermomicrobiales bacterium]
MELPVAVGLHDAAHLAIGGGGRPFGAAIEREVDAEAHHAVRAAGVQELDVTHGAGEVAEEEGGRLFVVPDVGAAAVARSPVIVAAFPAHHRAIRDAEGRLRPQGAEVVERGLLHDVGEIRAEDGVHEIERFRFQLRELGCGLDEHIPGIGEAGGVVVAHRGGIREVLKPRLAVREVPGEEEGEDVRFARRDRHLRGDGGNRVVSLAALAVVQHAIGGEVVPEVEDGIPPTHIRPGRPARNPLPLRQECERHRAPLLGIRIDAFRAEGNACDALGVAEIVAVAVGLAPVTVVADDVLQRTGDGDGERLVRLVGDNVPEQREGDTAAVGVGGNERIECLQPDSERDIGVAERDLPEGVRGLEGGVQEAGQSGVRGDFAQVALVGLGEEIPFETAGDNPGALALGADGEEGVLGGVALGRPVHHLPVVEVAASAEGDGASADAAEREGDAFQRAILVGGEDGPATAGIGDGAMRHAGLSLIRAIDSTPVGTAVGGRDRMASR